MKRQTKTVLALLFVCAFVIVSILIAQSKTTGGNAAAEEKTVQTQPASGCAMKQGTGPCACGNRASGKPCACAGECKNQKTAVQTEQPICPVTGEPADKTVFTDYQGKRVYFCCAPCKEKFLKSPETYLKKL